MLKLLTVLTRVLGARCESHRGDAAAEALGVPRGLPEWTGSRARPPPLPNDRHTLYDSVSGTEGDLAWCKHEKIRKHGAKYGRQYVVFNKAQSYPLAVFRVVRA